MEKMLIVLDDINDHDELAALLGTKAVNKKSKIIITTRILDINAWFLSRSWMCKVNVLELLNEHESLEVLSWHAFGSKIPMEGFKELAVQLTQYCGGNPLALKVLGSSLFVSAEDPRERKCIIEIWKSRLNPMNSLKGDLHLKIHDILRRSFDSLPFDSQKELFLHIACFFVGKDEDDVVRILEPDYNAKAGIMTLIHRCLLTVSPSNMLVMHQLLQEMGRKIVLGESKDPAKRSRVCCSDESCRVLREEHGSETIEGLALDMQKLKQGMISKAFAFNTSSLAKMDKLKFLQLKYVALTGSYKKFPELRWLCWHGCLLKTLPSGLLMSSLVALDMSYGMLKEFEPPMVVNSLKILNLEDSHKLVNIRSLHRFPNLETLLLRNCCNLTHVCKTIRGLDCLELMDLTGCKKLWKASWNKQYVITNNWERLKASFVGGGISQQPLFSLPCSLKFLFLNSCNLKHDSYISVVFNGQPFFYLNLGHNPFKSLPNDIDLKTLRVLDLTYCLHLEFLPCLPSTLEELYIYWCMSLEKVTFQSSRFRLREFEYTGCSNLTEVQGLFKLMSIEKISEADLGHMKWIKAYQDHKVDLVGDEITEGRMFDIQMLYEYGIMNTYLPGIKDQSLTTFEYTSSTEFLSFHVPACPKECRIQGLNVTFSYMASGEDEDVVLFAKISNTSRGLSWIYNPVVYCQPRVGEDVVWLSYWPIGNVLDTGDEVNVSIIVGNGLVVVGCGACLVYTDGEAEQENCKNYTKEGEVIGGDLSEFELTTGGYYLCRRDFFKSTTPRWSNKLFGNTIHCAGLQGWKKSRQSKASLIVQKGFRHDSVTGRIMVIRVRFCGEGQRHKVIKALSALMGVESITIVNKYGLVTVIGDVDPVAVVTRLRKKLPAEIVSVGPLPIPRYRAA